MSNYEDDSSGVRSSMNYKPGIEVWNFSLTSVAKFYASTTPTGKYPTISMDLNVGKRDEQNRTTVIDKRFATISIQLDNIEIMDFAAFLLGYRQSVIFNRAEKGIRLERQKHISAHQSQRNSPIPEFKIYLVATASWLDSNKGIAMSLLQSRAACIAALTLSQLCKQYNGILPPELLLASVRNFQLENQAESGDAHVALDSRPQTQIKSSAGQEMMARVPPNPRNID